MCGILKYAFDEDEDPVHWTVELRSYVEATWEEFETRKLLVEPRRFGFLQEDPGCMGSLTGPLLIIIEPIRKLKQA